MDPVLLAGGTPDLVICVPGSLSYTVAGDGTVLARASDVPYLASWGLTPVQPDAPVPDAPVPAAPVAEATDRAGGFAVDA